MAWPLSARKLAYERGIYVITRKWGNSESLIYVCRSKRSLIERINCHKRDWLTELRGSLFIRYAVIDLQPGQIFSQKRLADVESLLITTHKPPHNVVNYYYYNGRDKLTVTNTGRRGPLSMEVSTLELIDV